MFGWEFEISNAVSLIVIVGLLALAIVSSIIVARVQARREFK